MSHKGRVPFRKETAIDVRSSLESEWFNSIPKRSVSTRSMRKTLIKKTMKDLDKLSQHGRNEPIKWVGEGRFYDKLVDDKKFQERYNKVKFDIEGQSRWDTNVQQLKVEMYLEQYEN